jgi:hypothetical protein
MSRFLPIVTSIVLLLAYGLGAGYWTDRWAFSTELAQAPERLGVIPHRVGEWQGTDDALSPRSIRQAELHGSLWRHYRNRRTGETLHMLLVCGRPGPIAVHTPEVCLGGTGFEMKGKKSRQEVKAPQRSRVDVFWVAQFHKPDAAVPESIEMYWAWNGDSAWQVAENPRLAFASKRVLYKLYVSRAVVRPAASLPATEGAAGTGQAPIDEFLKVFLPEVKLSLFPA